MPAATPAAPLWTPTAERNEASGFLRYLHWLESQRGLHFSGYRDAWAWSTSQIEEFWASIWDFFEIDATLYTSVLDARRMPGAHWFAGAELNYAAHVFRNETDERPALLYRSETKPLASMSWPVLRAQVASLAAAMRELGVRRGDRVGALLPNTPEAVIALLACASIGAVWSACSPDFGAAGAAERFRQIEPRLLIAADGYTYAGRRFDRRGVVDELRQMLPTVEHVMLVPLLDAEARIDGTLDWSELVTRDVALSFERVPFDHPLWILYSSGSTGMPKAIVHGHGGILLEQLKSHVIQNDMRAGDRFFWYTTTGWMMWNSLVGGLLAGCTIVLYDGSAAHPDLDTLWRLADDARITRFGAGAAYYLACMNSGLQPGRGHDLTGLRAIGSTGSPLPADAFHWIYDAVKRDVWLASSSGGTEVATAFLGGCPLEPVHAGELQGAALGVRAAAFDEDGNSIVDEPGELVILEPMPSMPLYLWDDDDGRRYRPSYFHTYPGVWRHGDLVQFTARGSAVIHGRSDATLKRHGVRIGTAEIYRVVESVPEVVDSLVAGVALPDGGYWMPLFVALESGTQLDDALRNRITTSLRNALSPRHVPDEIIEVGVIPRTRNGKKLEVPVRRVLSGEPPDRVVDPASSTELRFYAELARARGLSSRDAGGTSRR